MNTCSWSIIITNWMLSCKQIQSSRTYKAWLKVYSYCEAFLQVSPTNVWKTLKLLTLGKVFVDGMQPDASYL